MELLPRNRLSDIARQSLTEGTLQISRKRMRYLISGSGKIDYPKGKKHIRSAVHLIKS